MKTAGRENQNRWAKIASNRAHGAEVQHRSCSINWAAKQEKVRADGGVFFLDFPFYRTYRELSDCRPGSCGRRNPIPVGTAPQAQPSGRLWMLHRATVTMSR